MSKSFYEVVDKKSKKGYGWTQLAKYFGYSVMELKKQVGRVTPKRQRPKLIKLLDKNEAAYVEAAVSK